MKQYLDTCWDWLTEPGLVKSPGILATGYLVSWSQIESVLKAICLVLTCIILSIQCYNAIKNLLAKNDEPK